MNNENKLNRKFYTRNAIVVAPQLLGKLLCRKDKATGATIALRITETEVYCGECDTACHAKNGKTARNAVMYGLGGFAYVYLCYGIHYLLNIVTGEENDPQCVLIRGVEDYDGPGKLTRKMWIDKTHHGADLTTSAEIWIEDDGFAVQPSDIITSPRVGINYATEEYRLKPWNFKLPPEFLS
jgi:DNA-3-methyladenine glycosylase